MYASPSSFNNSQVQLPPNTSLPSSSSSSLTNNGQVPQLWMGELDQRWDELTIKQIWTNLLSSLGIIIHSIKLIKDKQSTQLGLTNAGYCFIRFHNFEDASKVLNTFNGKPIPGTNNQHYFRLNWSSANIQAAAVAAAAASSLPLTASANPIEYSIFVGDLPQNINEQILLHTFKSKYPSCTSVKIMVDQSTGNIKGYGFVKFLNEEEQKRSLIEMQGFVLLDRAIRVSTASKSNSSSINNSNVNNNSNVSLSNNSSTNSISNNLPSIPTAQVHNSQSQQHQQQHQHQQQPLSPSSLSSLSQLDNNKSLIQPLPQNVPLQYFNDPANTTVFIGGLNVPFSEKQMFDLFSKYGNISYVKIPTGKNCGFVQYFHRASAEMAINEMQGFDIGGGCKIRVSWGARAAQRSWFARQLQFQSQNQSQTQTSNTNSNQPTNLTISSNSSSSQSIPLNSSFEQLNNNDINFNLLLNNVNNPNSNANENLGLFESYFNLNENMLNNNLNGYSIDQYNFQNEMIPYNSLNNFNNNINNLGNGLNNLNGLNGVNGLGNINLNNSNSNPNNLNINFNDEFKLNKLLLAARDGNLDQLDLGSNVYN